jgi:hypothetical protein
LQAAGGRGVCASPAWYSGVLLSWEAIDATLGSWIASVE